MAFKDLREWIDKLEAEGELKRIKAKVNWDLELAEIMKKVMAQRGPALLFENIKDYENTRSTRVFMGGLGTRRRICLMLGLPKDTPQRELVQETRKRFKEQVKPIRVNTGPVKENIIKGEDINLFEFPVPKFNPLDGGRYINTFAGVVTRDPDTGDINIGIYRGMICGKNKISTLVTYSKDWGVHYAKYKEKGKPMPVAVIYGWDPALLFVAGTPLPYQQEYDVMGAIRQEPVPLVSCETSDLEVPASAEIVVEGSISPDPNTYEMEGPFGEWRGYYSAPRKRPVIKVDCITHRNDAIFRGQVEGTKPGVISEGGYTGFTTFGALIWNTLESQGVAGVIDVVPAPVTVIKIHKTYQEQAKQIAAALWGSKLGTEMMKVIMVVDEDVDIDNLRALQLAFLNKVDVKNDLVVFPGSGDITNPCNPLEDRDEQRYGTVSQNNLLIDATIDWRLHPIREEWGNRRFPPICTETPPEIERLVEQRWKEYGF